MDTAEASKCLANLKSSLESIKNAINSDVLTRVSKYLSNWIKSNPDIKSKFTTKRPHTDLEIIINDPDSNSLDSKFLYVYRIDLIRGSSFFEQALKDESTTQLDMSHRGINELLFVLDLIEPSFGYERVEDDILCDAELMIALEFVNSYYDIKLARDRLDSAWELDISDLDVERAVELLKLVLRLRLDNRLCHFYEAHNSVSDTSIDFWIEVIPIAYDFKHAPLLKHSVDFVLACFMNWSKSFDHRFWLNRDDMYVWPDKLQAWIFKQIIVARYESWGRDWKSIHRSLQNTPLDESKLWGSPDESKSD